jgi:D-proline reductase (dithiol) PrdB
MNRDLRQDLSTSSSRVATGNALAVAVHKGNGMNKLNRLKNRVISRFASSIPVFAKYLTASYTPQRSEDIPWSPIKKPLTESKIALVTTAGVHHTHQEPFDMNDPAGDPTYRIIDAQTIEDDYLITHDYYDHRDADKDLNIVFPFTRLKEMAAEGIVGSVARHHFSFMGHIKDSHLDHLLETHAPQVANRLVEDRVDAVLLTPG